MLWLFCHFSGWSTNKKPTRKPKNQKQKQKTTWFSCCNIIFYSTLFIPRRTRWRCVKEKNSFYACIYIWTIKIDLIDLMNFSCWKFPTARLDDYYFVLDLCPVQFSSKWYIYISKSPWIPIHITLETHTYNMYIYMVHPVSEKRSQYYL